MPNRSTHEICIYSRGRRVTDFKLAEFIVSERKTMLAFRLWPWPPIYLVPDDTAPASMRLAEDFIIPLKESGQVDAIGLLIAGFNRAVESPLPRDERRWVNKGEDVTIEAGWEVRIH